MNFAEIESMVLDWADKRLIFSESNATYQCHKLYEEFKELVTAVLDNNRADVIDSLGDMMVVMTMISHFYNLDLTKCYEIAYDEIKDRKGKMVNGLFVKD